MRPVLEYGAEIWGRKFGSRERRYRWKMGRRVLGVSNLTTREVIQGELGLESIRSRRIVLRLRFWCKILKMKKCRLVYQIYNKGEKNL